MSMKNRRVFVFSVLIVIVVLMLEMRFKAVSECLLMESKHSLYSRLFMLEKEGWGTYTINDLDSSNRLALNTLREINGSGISLTRSKDGSITVVGRNTTNRIVCVHLSDNQSLDLNNGDYIISYGEDMINNNNLLFYFEGRSIAGETIRYTKLASLPDNPMFSLEKELYDDIGLVLAFTPDFETEKPIILYPQIRHAFDSSDEYMPPAVIKSTIEEGKTGFQTFKVDKAEFNQLTDGDWKIFKNNLKYQFHGTYVWTSIIFEDGTGVQFKDSDPNQAVYGPIDSWGRVDEPLCDVNSLDEIKAVCQPV